MGRGSLGVITGLVVLVTGVVAVTNLTGPTDRPIPDGQPPPIITLVSPEPTGTRVAGLPDVGLFVTRVLEWSGNVRLADAGDVAQLPPSVASVLIEYGIPLRVPVSSGQTP